MKRSTYIVRIELPSGGRYSVTKYAVDPKGARGQVELPEGARIVNVSKMRAAW